ncbi:monooxygenase FAD-binding protein [Sphingobium chlorophenolicum L-1]|uniref:Monooxygenase FAD-binding protein n=1 Tax=Sphingobium chlorophenolicum L-1 TaxID=690566 RepID=F6EWX9_SPHCR|nr:FAD-dependent oxidoreductase [Sphingobium chlorophenolicum]AEG48142.1 monooxygenase FAD-binding protein [Sphingobium chlorophenolicum L-1]
MTATNRANGVPVWRAVGTTPLASVSDASSDVVIVGAGPVGLTVALDLGRRGHRVTVLNRLDCVAAGSKAICFAKRTLDIWDRLGVGERMVEKGVVWNVGKVFWGEAADPIYSFDMLPVKHQKMPGFINLQQYHAEEILHEALAQLPNVEIRWGHEVVGVQPREDGVTLDVVVEEESYSIDGPWVIACDGSRSPVRQMLGLDFEGRVFEDNFLIADIKVNEDRPAERWFWFDPPFNPGQSALLHKQPDDVWRLDFQLGWNIDREACILPENVAPYVRGMLGDDIEFEQIWYSVYTFQCRRMAHFVHGRVVFAGDSAHLVSPFGARGCNGGVADADNLGWKLDLVLRGAAPVSLIESYDYEAIVTADENILNSTRSTDFMTPKSLASRAMRDAVLELAQGHAFARPFVNSGRLSTAVSYPASALSTADEPDAVWAGIRPGNVALDAPTGNGWLLEHLTGGRFVLLTCQASVDAPPGVVHLALEHIGDPEGLATGRYDLQRGSAYLIRPDQYVAARWRQPTAQGVAAALNRAKGNN